MNCCNTWLSILWAPFSAATWFFLVLTISTSVDGSIRCYQCDGGSGSSLAASNSYCGLPFYDNSSYPLTTVTCSGLCVTQVIFSGESSRSTTIYRSCSDAPVTDGCLYSESGSHQTWSCIKTCNTDKCNTGSDGTILAPPTVVHLLVFATASLATYVKTNVIS